VSGRLSAALAGLVLVGACATLAVPEALSRNTIRGEATVIDGDTIDVGGVRVRLWGIDAPEGAQVCGGVSCGLAATAGLLRLIGGDTVACTERDRDRYGRIVARCGTERVPDLGGMMVALGMAVAYRRYSDAYRDHEAAAKAERLGLWRSNFVNPEDWRKGKR